MDFSDIIGYIISILALFYFMRGGSKKQENESEEHPDDQAQKLKDFLRSLEDDMQEQPPKPVVVQIPKKKVVSPPPKPIVRVEEQHLKTADYKDYVDPYQHYVDPYQHYKDNYKVKKVSVDIGNAPAYEVSGREGVSRADQLLSQLKSRKEMVLLHEIFGKPKGL